VSAVWMTRDRARALNRRQLSLNPDLQYARQALERAAIGKSEPGRGASQLVYAS